MSMLLSLLFDISFQYYLLMQIGESAGAECKAALQETNKLVEQRLATDAKAVKTLFGAAEV